MPGDHDRVSRVAPIRHLGRVRLVAVGINSVVGGGIFILPAAVAALVGPASIPAYLMAGMLVLGIGSAMAVLASRYDASGGPYLYTRRAFGGFIGFQVGWLFCLARLSAMANLWNGFARYVGTLVPGGDLLLVRTALVLLCAAPILAINIIGIRQTSSATNLFVAAKFFPLLLLGLAGLPFLDPEHFIIAQVDPTDFVRSVLLLIYAFTGFEVLTVPAEESLRPRRDMPFALLATIASISALYILVQVTATGLLPDLATERAPLAAAAGILFGVGGLYLMTSLGALSMAGCSLGSLIGGTRLLYSMSEARQIPTWLGDLDPRRRTPVRATLAMGGLAALLAVIGGYAELAAVSAGSRLLVYLACCLASVRGARDAGGLGATRWRSVVALLTSGVIVALLTGLERREVIAGMIGVIGGTVLYVLARRGRSVTAREG